MKKLILSIIFLSCSILAAPSENQPLYIVAVNLPSPIKDTQSVVQKLVWLSQDPKIDGFLLYIDCQCKYRDTFEFLAQQINNVFPLIQKPMSFLAVNCPELGYCSLGNLDGSFSVSFSLDLAEINKINIVDAFKKFSDFIFSDHDKTPIFALTIETAHWNNFSAQQMFKHYQSLSVEEVEFSKQVNDVFASKVNGND